VLRRGERVEQSGDRSGKGQAGGPRRRIEKQPFSKPILIARDPSNGLAIVFLCDPRATTSLAGQYHGWDTAHDWWFGANLVAGQPMSASARMIFRRFKDVSPMFAEVENEWTDFVRELTQLRRPPAG